MCPGNTPRCVWGTHEKVYINTQLYVCCFEDKKKVCCSNTPYLRVLKLLFNTVVAVYLKRIELFSSIAKKTLFFLGILTIFNIFIVPVALFFPGKFSRQASAKFGMEKTIMFF